jgi:hypothetical protein
MRNAILSTGYLIRLLLAFAALVCLSTLQGAHGQSLNVCESNELHPEGQNVLVNVCIAEWISNDTPQIDAYVDVMPDSNSAAYIPFSDAEMNLGSTTTNNNLTFLGQSDWNNYTDQPEDPSEDTDAGVTVAMTLGSVYDAGAGYGYCYDPTGNYGYDPGDGQYDNCTWTDYWANPIYDLETNFFDPSAQVISVLYPPPGDQSTTGYTSGTTNGTTTSVGSSFTQAYGIQFSGSGSAEPFSFGGSISYTQATTSGNTTAFQTTLTDLSGVTERANTLAQYNSSSPQKDMPNHLWDSFLLVLNPQITTANDDSDNIQGYSIDIQPIAGDGWITEADPAEVVTEDMIDGTVYPGTLNMQQLPQLPGQPQYFLPGLASICKNLIQSEYNGGTCSLGDQCGCQVSDFSPILGQDALLGWNKNTLTANPLPGYESPVDADISGAACLTPNSSLNCRYVPVPTSSTNPAPQLVQLNSAFDNSFAQTDVTSTSFTNQQSSQYTVTLTSYFGWEISAWGNGLSGGLKLTNTDSWTWTNMSSQGTINGIQNSMNVNLETNNSGCVEDNYVYEDTQYHTFVVQPPDNVPNCIQ